MTRCRCPVPPSTPDASTITHPTCPHHGTTNRDAVVDLTGVVADDRLVDRLAAGGHAPHDPAAALLADWRDHHTQEDQ